MKTRYTIKQLVEFAKNEMHEFAFATEAQLEKVIEIFIFNSKFIIHRYFF